jgi:hypothetical protein
MIVFVDDFARNLPIDDFREKGGHRQPWCTR